MSDCTVDNSVRQGDATLSWTTSSSLKLKALIMSRVSLSLTHTQKHTHTHTYTHVHFSLSLSLSLSFSFSLSLSFRLFLSHTHITVDQLRNCAMGVSWVFLSPTHTHTHTYTRIHFSLSCWAWRFCLVDKQGHGQETTRQQFQGMVQTAVGRSEATDDGSLPRCVHSLQRGLRGRSRRKSLLRCASIWIQKVRPKS